MKQVVEQKVVTKAEKFALDVEQQIEQSLRTKKKAEAVYISGDIAQRVGKAYKKVAEMLQRFGIPFSAEDGCYWVKAEKYDSQASRFLPTGQIATSIVDIWVYYEDGEISIGIADNYLFTCTVEETEEVPLFLNAYFKSKFGKGKLIRKQIENEIYE